MAYKTNAADQVFHFIQERIASGEWKPGDKIWTEMQLAEYLGISRVAVRRAIDRLVGLSQLRKVQGSGTFVTECDLSSAFGMGLITVSEEDVLDVLEFRRYFECGNIEMFLKNAAREDVEALEKYYDVMCRAAEQNDMDAFYMADYHFHDIIAQGTKKPFILQISKILTGLMMQHQRSLNYYIGPEVGLEYHRHILKAIKEGDRELASLYMRKHIDAAISEVRSVNDKEKEKKNES
ncbi:FadR/GntR family transcriptional regulator [Yanshouia hominis]|mgnify:CR=1 FL=1|uniref:FadR family transcriptional regulator n=1 Tax=Yanshouia hominis TaxID=2763673 RepID=A0ABR7NGB4_9FIRM|nr:FCD domain-containing protein [Yanshouia hominis]MBC8574887.1 FadR family transcriptional regulator [Yanshouia hominis]